MVITKIYFSSGRCYPCVFMTTLSCNCGKTKVQVLCEQRHRARLPKCQELCMTPPTCHHPSRTCHLCHSKECPPCVQKCCKALDCGHICPVACHSEPKHRPKEVSETVDTMYMIAEIFYALYLSNIFVIILGCSNGRYYPVGSNENNSSRIFRASYYHSMSTLHDTCTKVCLYVIDSSNIYY